MKVRLPMGMVVSGDWHGGPDDNLPASVYAAADYARARCMAFVANGDVFDLLIYGVEAYRRGTYLALVRNLFASLAEVYFIVGNHEGRLAWVKPLFGDMPHVHVVKRLDVVVGGACVISSEEIGWCAVAHRARGPLLRRLVLYAAGLPGRGRGHADGGAEAVAAHLPALAADDHQGDW